MNYAYLHGFAEDAGSPKGRRLAEVFRQHGIELQRPDLNWPSFSQLSYSGMLEAIDMMDLASNGEPWRFVATSMGAYVAARWAELHPERVDGMVLLSPAFDMVDIWADMLGEEFVQDWETEGEFLFFGPDDNLQPVHWELFADARDNHPAYPEADCPTKVIHGREDELVPLAKSETFVERSPSSELVVLDDAHKLENSVWRVAREALSFFSPGLTGRSDRLSVKRSRAM